MKLKRVLAAIAAAAVAVSAMATTVFAEDSDKTTIAHYSLVLKENGQNDGWATFSATVPASQMDLVEDNTLAIIFNNSTTNPTLAFGPDWNSMFWSVTSINPISNTVVATKHFTDTAWAAGESWTTPPNAQLVSETAFTYGANGSVTFTLNDPILVQGNEIRIAFRVPHQINGNAASAIQNEFLSGQGTDLRFEIRGDVTPGAQPTMAQLNDLGVASATNRGTFENYWPMATNVHGRVDFRNLTNGLEDMDVQYFWNTYENNASGMLDNANNYAGAGYGLTTQQDVIAYLGMPGLADFNRPYYNVQAVINDTAAKYNSVTIIFHTAVENVGNVSTGDSRNFGRYVEGDDAERVSTSYYKQFRPQLYNRFHLDADYMLGENYMPVNPAPFVGHGDYTQDYRFYSLLNGALVINGQHTMQLSDLNMFDYTSKSISFNLEDVFGAGNNNNIIAPGGLINPAPYQIWSMRLATSNLWFWDSMEIQAGMVAEETVDAYAPPEEDDDVIDDIDDWDDFGDDDWGDDDWGDDVWDDPIPEPTPVVPNPVTGNASVALAVIPVALAAAAIVIKKRK